jgi:hypothetical protein
MTTLFIPRSAVDAFDEGERMICCYCDQEVFDLVCFDCNEYKGVMAIADWEIYYNETWED